MLLEKNIAFLERDYLCTHHNSNVKLYVGLKGLKCLCEHLRSNKCIIYTKFSLDTEEKHFKFCLPTSILCKC